jgi:hypothetical protein
MPPNRLVSCVPKATIAVSTTTARTPTSSAYSTALAPFSSSLIALARSTVVKDRVYSAWKRVVTVLSSVGPSPGGSE